MNAVRPGGPVLEALPDGGFRLDLPLNPVPYPRTGGNGRQRFNRPELKQFYADFRWLASAARVRPLDGDLRVWIRVWRRCRSRVECGDKSNLEKAIEDAGQPSPKARREMGNSEAAWRGYLWHDDRQIRDGRLVIVEFGPQVEGRILVEVAPFAENGA